MSEAGKILFIDDSEVVLAEVKRALTAEGYQVTATAQTVGAARHLMQVDLVILDFHMPGIDGQQVLESLRSAVRSAEKKPAFYLYTTDRELAGRYRSLGFDGAFMEKGNHEALVRQVGAAFRMIRLKRGS
jgi:two-component system, OmpR family, response regulator